MQQNTQLASAPVALSGAMPRTIAPSSYSVKSVTTSEGHRAHTVTTRDRNLANALFGAALDVDDAPLNGKSHGLYRVYFYCSDDECDGVIVAAQGGNKA